MPGDDVLTHRNHGGQTIIIQRHAQRAEVVVAIEDARVLVLHSLQTAQRFQRGFHWDSSDAQIEVERVTRKHQVSLVIDKHHLTGGVTGTFVGRHGAAAQVKLHSVRQIVDDRHGFIGTGLAQIDLNIVGVQAIHIIRRTNASFLPLSNMLRVIAAAGVVHGDFNALILRVEPDFAELACIGRVVNMAVGNDADQRLVGNHLDCAAQIANTHAAVNDHRLFRADQQENTGTVKFINLPGVLLNLHHGVQFCEFRHMLPPCKICI